MDMLNGSCFKQIVHNAKTYGKRHPDRDWLVVLKGRPEDKPVDGFQGGRVKNPGAFLNGGLFDQSVRTNGEFDEDNPFEAGLVGDFGVDGQNLAHQYGFF